MSPALSPATDVRDGHLGALNPSQREAVEATDGPVLVLAGAGTGKTRVLTTRLAHILMEGKARPWEVLAVTFTNKAAREMKERVARLLSTEVEGWWVGTFHAMGARLLRVHAEAAGLKPNFTILDTDDQTRLVKQLMEARGLDEKRWPARTVHAIIQRWKDRGLEPAAVTDGEDAADGRALALYGKYQERLAGAERRRLRRPFAALPNPVSNPSRHPRSLPAEVPLHPGGRVPGFQYRPVPVAALARTRDPEISAASATTTSPSTPGGGRRWATSYASRRTSPAPG